MTMPSDSDSDEIIITDDDIIGVDDEDIERRIKLGEYAKEFVWSDEDWNLLRRYFASDLTPEGPMSEEDLLLQGTYRDFKNESQIRQMERGAEWEPSIPSDDTIIRRYITFDKFIALIMNNGFWLSNINEFSDQFEASFPKPSVNHKQSLVDFEKERGVEGQVSYGVKQQRKRDNQTYVSCWRIGEDESSIFWDSYVGNKKGLAIQTTVGKLKNHLDDQIWEGYIDKLIDKGHVSAISEYQKLLAGRVNYLKYENEIISESKLSPSRFFHKRDGFAAEREFRIIKTVPPMTDLSNLPEPKPGIVITGDLDKIIDKIIFPPETDGLYQRLVEMFASDSLGAEVERSELEKNPEMVEL